MKAFQHLVSGEDDELAVAYTHFHNMVKREQGVVQTAILVNVEKVRKGTNALYTDLTKGMAVAQNIEHNTMNLVIRTDKMYRSLESKNGNTNKVYLLAT